MSFAGSAYKQLMKLHESIEIPARPEQVWALISDPETWPGWNPRIQTVRRDRNGALVLGEQFHATFKISVRDVPSSFEVLELDPNRRLVFRQRYDDRLRVRWVDVTFGLTATSGGVRVTQTVDLSCSGIWWPLRLLIACIHRFGRPSGNGPLDELRSCFTTRQDAVPVADSRLAG
jgi:uncharacterized protein YndB with AHSA1/START domain